MKRILASIFCFLALAFSASAFGQGAPVQLAGQVGQTATLTVTVTAGTPPLTYVWDKNGAIVAGQSASTLVIPNVQLTDSATYTATVSNTAGSTTSNSLVLTITAVPPTGASLTGSCK